MTVYYKSGDLLSCTEGAMAHGVNCQGQMGAGVAKVIRGHYGESMFLSYRIHCLSRALRPGGVHVWTPPDLPDLFNIASQDMPGRDAKIEWLSSGLAMALDVAAIHGYETVAVPRIGCGIGGLDWKGVEPVYNATSTMTGVDLVVYTP